MIQKPFLAALVILLVLVPHVFAENYVAINSMDGRDVLSGIFYANVKGEPVRFVPVPGGTSDVFATKVGSGHSILLIESSTLPASGFAKTALEANGNQVELYSTTDGLQTNLDLAARSGASSFIIVDSAYSDAAVSVIPYAKATGSYVIFADNTDIDKVKSIVQGKQITIYGYVDSQVKDALAQDSPQYIGDGADKYADNVALVEKYMSGYPTANPIITDGSMLEDTIISGTSPIILIGKLVPQVTYNFIEQEVRDGKITGVLLVTSELEAPVYDMRERIRTDLLASGQNKTFSMLVKFGQATGTQSGVLGLDTFRVPSYVPHINVTEVVYNQQDKQLMIGLENVGDGPLYYVLEARVTVNGNDYRAFGSNQTALIELGDSQGVEYPLDLSGVQEGAVASTVVVKYGSTSQSLDSFVTSGGSLAAISYQDTSNVSVRSAKYDVSGQQLLLTLSNGGSGQAFAFVKVLLKDENGQDVTISAPAIQQLDPSSLTVEQIPLGLSAKELDINKQLSVSVQYGGRRGFLAKSASYVVPLEEQAGLQLQPEVLGAIAAAIILVVLYLAYKFLSRKKAS